MEHTERGFAIHNFEDRNEVKCSLQKSSLATEDAVWLGCNEINLKRFTPGIGWESIPLTQDGPDGVAHIANTRMHLTREQVEELLPFLNKFVQTGSLE